MDAGSPFPGDRTPTEEPAAGDVEDAPDDATSLAVDPPSLDLIQGIEDFVAGLPFKSLAELKTLEASRNYKARLAALKVSAPDKAAEVERALSEALEAFG